MINVQGLTKHFGSQVAVDHLTFEVPSGQVTGFLGPNGAGKTTTLRLVVGLAKPDSGVATIKGLSYPELKAPMREVGTLLDAKAFHPGRKAKDHLLALAQAGRIPASRVDEVLGIVGLSDVADKRAGAFSLGMSQRLGIAAALLGDPGVLIFDEPVNGLDPEGILWIRNFMHALAAQGRTVLVSSHLMSEMAQTASYVVVIGRGRLIATASMQDLIQRASPATVLVRTPGGTAVIPRLEAAGGRAVPSPDGALVVSGLDARTVGDIVFAAGAPVHELVTQEASLEEVFMELTRDDVEYQAGMPTPPNVAPGLPATGQPSWPGGQGGQP